MPGAEYGGDDPARAPAGRGRQRVRNVLDRFAIDFSLCMYCGICVEACPYDALFWSPEFSYAETDIAALTHEQGRLREWMWTVPPPPRRTRGQRRRRAEARIPGPCAKISPATSPGRERCDAGATWAERRPAYRDLRGQRPAKPLVGGGGPRFSGS